MDAEDARHSSGAADAARRIREGLLTSQELVETCLERIRALEPNVQAWTFLDEEHALAQARAADEKKALGEPIGPLHGVPVGVKDIIDTADMPTENGTVLHKGRTPRNDAAVVAMLRAAGAVILGKTVTTECAYYAPGKTRNPHNPEHTPGGSSSGSAAAVAASMVPAGARQPDQRLGDPARRRSAASTASSRRTAWFRAPASCSYPARSTTSACSRAASTISPCSSSSLPVRTRAIPTPARARAFRFASSPPRSRRSSRCSLSSRRRTGSAPTRTPRKRSRNW